ncbi:MAG: DUF4215 domain-containing protein [Candidatus Omnitrophica bacterium]|nr:DUF4215 domain-containing protein [Candidatus Omnitrophota bacterium]
MVLRSIKLNNHGQNIIEYLLVFIAVILVVFLILQPNGYITKKTEEVFDKSMIGVGCIMQDICYEKDGCTWVCGNGCCERSLGEKYNNCSRDCSPICGNNELEGPEECDDGNRSSEDGCSSACKIEFCGDSITQIGLGEECDDGNITSGDGCSSNCKNEP